MLKQFWHNDITEKSFVFLKKMKNEFKFILIGGWAVYFYTRKIKSKDIDIIIEYDELGRIRKRYDTIKNERLKKYEINRGEFDIDIYLPHYSRIGFPLEIIKNHTVNIEGFIMPRVEILLAMKLFAYRERRNSLKGDKDRLDIISLLDSVDIDWQFMKIEQSLFNAHDIAEAITDVFKNINQADELGINNQRMSKLKKSILDNF